MADTAAATIIGPHGAKVLPSVEVDSCNLELKDDKTFPYLMISVREDFPRVEVTRSS